ncbi:MAG: SDR family oxidoreductase [Bacteroidales bacterium]|jgi:3-oxoacyl-[acyl-carrier protein] reductase|nr:SDR family oxidoreductase [Bacteroidales bacterium]
MGKFDKKVALVTGSSVGIGKAIAIAYANEGAEVIVVSHKTVDKGKATAQEIINKGGKAIYVQSDLTTQKGVDYLFAEVGKHHKKIDILVNNVGHAFATPFDQLSEETIIRDLSSNFLATVLCSKKVLEFMEEGHIINTSSIRGLDYAGRTHLIGYCSGKAAVNSFTKNIALQYAPKIFVNAVAPGFVWTEALSKSGEELIQKWLGTIPIKRFITPEELAEVYVFLATSKMFTGSIIAPDGGYTLLEKQ